MLKETKRNISNKRFVSSMWTTTNKECEEYSDLLAIGWGSD